MTNQNVTILALSGGSFSAAELAHDRTLAFLKQHLGSAVIQGVIV
jgi:hypothetical protein